jgi:hypothetical protein
MATSSHILAQTPALVGAPTLSNTIGALVFGWGISNIVFGMLCIQVWRYYQRYPNDPWSYKVLVSSCCCMFHPMVADALLCSLFFLITLVLRERSACRSSRSGMPISICLYRHLAFTIDQGPGGPSPSINWSYHLVLRRREFREPLRISRTPSLVPLCEHFLPQF